MSVTTAVTIQAYGNGALLSKSAPTIKVDQKLSLKTTALDADSQPSGQKVKVSSSDPLIAQLFGANELGAADLSIQGKAPGIVTLTAVAMDASTVTATMTVTVV